MGKPKANPTRIQKSGNGHQYFLEGEKVPGVTTVLSDGIPKGGLIGWAANSVAEYVINRLQPARTAEGKIRIVADELVADLLAWNETREQWAREKVSGGERLPRLALSRILANIRYADSDAAAGQGTAVHNLAEQLANGQTVDVPTYLRGHVESYLRFLREWDPTQAMLERVIVNRKWRYMGKLDMICWIADDEHPDGGEWWLIDIKTSRSGVFSEVALQLAGYRYGEVMLVTIDGEQTEIPMPQVTRCGVLWVRSDGYDLVPVTAGPAEFRVFLYAKGTGDWLAKDGPGRACIGAALEPPHRTTTDTTTDTIEEPT